MVPGVEVAVTIPLPGSSPRSTVATSADRSDQVQRLPSGSINAIRPGHSSAAA
jgi:hypothetical protein